MATLWKHQPLSIGQQSLQARLLCQGRQETVFPTSYQQHTRPASFHAHITFWGGKYINCIYSNIHVHVQFDTQKRLGTATLLVVDLLKLPTAEICSCAHVIYQC